MKKLCTFVILSILLSFGLNAQDLTFGAKAGINIASWSSNAVDVGARLGYHLGGVCQYPINDDFGVQAELLLSLQGVRSTDDDNPGRANFTYLAIPLLATYGITPEISVNAGFQPAFALSSKQVITSGSHEGDYDIDDEFSGFDFAFVFGGEYRIKEEISAGLRVALSLNDIATHDEEEAKNRLVQIYGKYTFLPK